MNEAITVIAVTGKSSFLKFLLNNGLPYFVSTSSKEFADQVKVGSLLDIHGQVFKVVRKISSREYNKRYENLSYNHSHRGVANRADEIAWYEVETD